MSSEKFFITDFNDFLEIATRARTQINPPGPGWGVFRFNCPECSLHMMLVRPVNTLGFLCPYCRYENKEFRWHFKDVHNGEGAFLAPVGYKYATTNLN